MSSADLKLTIKALVLLIVETVKTKVTRSDFDETLFACLGPEQSLYFWEFIQSQRQFIVNVLRHYTTADEHFRDLEWRMEAKVATRCQQPEQPLAVPQITMKLYLDTEEIAANRSAFEDIDGVAGGDATTRPPQRQQQASSGHGDEGGSTVREILFQTDPTNLSHAIEVLEQALDETKNHRVKNYVKSVQQQQ